MMGTSTPTQADPVVAAAPRTKRSPIFVELAWLIFLIWIYNWLQDLAPLRRGQAYSNARALLSFERRIGLNPEATLDHWLAHQQVLAYVASNFYAVAIFGATFAFAAWTWWNRPDLYVALRNYIVLANLIAFVIFWAFPVAPPRMLAGFVDIVAQSGGLGWHNSLVHHADQLAAMPSMHVGYAVWCSIVAWRLARSPRAKRWALAFGISYPLLTSLAVMATGNHYLLDVIAGAATTGVAVLLVEAVTLAVGRLRAPSIILSPARPAVPCYAGRQSRVGSGSGVVTGGTNNHVPPAERGAPESNGWRGPQRVPSTASTASRPQATADQG